MDSKLTTHRKARKLKRHIRGDGFEIVVNMLTKTFKVNVFRPTSEGYWSMTRVCDRLAQSGFSND